VPEDLSVVGFDDFQVATRVFPMLTTLRSPIRTIGSLAARRLFERVAEGRGDLSVGDPSAPPPQLVVRKSSGPAPA